MGQLRFLAPQPERVSAEAVERAHMVGLDWAPTWGRKTWEGPQILRLERSVDESGNFYIPWTVQGHGELLLSTASLMERPREYHLPVELARGTVNRLRSRAEAWQYAGLQVPDELRQKIRDCVADFRQAAMSQQDPITAAEWAEETIRKSLDVIIELGALYAREVLRLRHQEASPLPTLLAGHLGEELMPDNAEPMFGAAFNAAVIPLTWKQIQPGPDQWKWTIADKQMQQCLRQRFKIFGGPLLRFDPAFFPEWAFDGAGGAERLTTLVRKFIQAVIGRYRGQVQLWHAVAGANLPGELPINEDQRVRLTVMAVETAKRADPRTPAIVSFDQPWAEYLSEQTGELPPLHLADSLVRAEVGLAGIGMELNLGYWPGGSLVRDELEIGQLIDNWSLLGLPLIPLLAIPSSDAEDPLAQLAQRPGGLPPRAKLPGGASPDNQKRLIERILPGLLAKQSVQAIVWNQVFDSLPHKYPHGGLFRENGLPKPSLASLIAIRSQHLE